MSETDQTNRNVTPLIFIRSLLFFVLMLCSTVIISPMIISTVFFPFRVRYRVTSLWVYFNLWAVRLICGIRYEVEGAENIPAENGIIMCKHQSAWETIALQRIFPPQVFVLKKELLHLPIWGWAMACLQPIAIDRQSQKEALRQLLRQGKERLHDGIWVTIFPEGTRVAPGEKGRYGGGGSMLGQQTGYPIVPVAHNAGEFWKRQAFLKFPGTIKVRIGPVIQTRGRKSGEINADVENWIESNMAEISSAYHKPVTEKAAPSA